LSQDWFNKKNYKHLENTWSGYLLTSTISNDTGESEFVYK